MLRYPAPESDIGSCNRVIRISSYAAVGRCLRTNLMPRREGKKNRSRRYSMKLVGKPRSPLLLPLLNHPGGATLFNFVSGGNIAKSPASSTARPKVKFSSSLSAWTIAWKKIYVQYKIILKYFWEFFWIFTIKSLYTFYW